jgi:RimJ/RimL family protein N-acetyltransferase
MKLENPGLENAALRFVPLDASHRDLVLKSGIEEGMWKWAPALRGGVSFAQYFDFMIQAQGQGIYTSFALYRKTDNQFIGLTGYTDTNQQHRRTRIAIAWFAPNLFEPRLFQYAQLGLLKRAYDWRARRVEWSLNPDNEFFMRQMAFIGPTKEATMRNYERLASGKWADKVVYSMLRPEMVEAIKKLEDRLDAAP